MYTRIHLNRWNVDWAIVYHLEGRYISWRISKSQVDVCMSMYFFFEPPSPKGENYTREQNTKLYLFACFASFIVLIYSLLWCTLETPLPFNLSLLLPNASNTSPCTFFSCTGDCCDGLTERILTHYFRPTHVQQRKRNLQKESCRANLYTLVGEERDAWLSAQRIASQECFPRFTPRFIFPLRPSLIGRPLRYHHLFASFFKSTYWPKAETYNENIHSLW